MTTKYMRRASAGVCVRCESPNVTHGRRCKTCRDYFNLYAKKRQAETQLVGGCISCGGIAATGYSRCDKCRAVNAQRAKEFRRARK